jgi:hypothetical protein
MVNKALELTKGQLQLIKFLGAIEFPGDVSVAGDLTITGSSNIGVDETVTGTLTTDKLIIDGDDTESLLVRKDGDAGDVFVVDTVNSKVGIGTTSPDTLLQITNNDWFSAKDNAGTSYVNMLRTNTSDELEVGATLNTGPFEFEEDSGAITAMNMPVSSTSSDGDEMSMTMSIASNPILKIYGEANGTGGTDTHKVIVTDAVITGGGLQLNHQALTSSTLTLDANDGVVECDTTSNAIAITLPEASTVLGQNYTIYFETDGGNDVTVTTATGDTFAGVGDIGDNTATMADAGDFVVIQAVSDTRWIVIQNNGATLSTV